MEKWVQHISGEGRKYQVNGHNELAGVYGVDGGFYLPTFEYKPCDPPERWEDVTDRVRIVQATVPLKGAGSVDAVKCGDDTIATLHCGGRYVVSFNPFTVKRRL